MLIRCKIDRGPDGSRVEFPEGGPYNTVAGSYHFVPNKKGDPVAEVSEASHLAFFLGLAAESYELYDPSPKKKAAPAPEPEPEPVKPEDPLQPLAPEKGEG